MRHAAFAAVTLVALTFACGHKGAILAPELVRPEPPTELAASATPQGVRLTWTRPTKYTGGQRMRDLGSFLIERADAATSPLVFARAGTVELQDQKRFRQDRRLEYVDTTAEPGHEYVYRVRARTVDGYDSPWTGPATVRVPPASPSPAKPDTSPRPPG